MLINGKSASKEDFELLNLDQIESISVIKGKEAIEKYGKKAKEGVIIIIMK
jgi:outer membrane receptor for ferrienterochelin and colicin